MEKKPLHCRGEGGDKTEGELPAVRSKMIVDVSHGELRTVGYLSNPQPLTWFIPPMAQPAQPLSGGGGWGGIERGE